MLWAKKLIYALFIISSCLRLLICCLQGNDILMTFPFETLDKLYSLYAWKIVVRNCKCILLIELVHRIKENEWAYIFLLRDFTHSSACLSAALLLTYFAEILSTILFGEIYIRSTAYLSCTDYDQNVRLCIEFLADWKGLLNCLFNPQFSYLVMKCKHLLSLYTGLGKVFLF